MNERKKAKLKKAGYKVGPAKEFLRPKRFILIGGVPFRGYTGTLTYTELKEVGRVNTKKQLKDLMDKNNDACGGLFHVVDLEG